MLKLRIIAAAFSPMLLLAACAQTPMGPTTPVMPAPGKPFAVFQEDQAICKNFAENQLSGGAQDANNRQVLTGLGGAALGAATGALLGGGRGAAVGAGIGGVGGVAVGGAEANRQQGSLQYRYDLAYSQCMYSRGNQVPGYAPASAPPPGYGQPVYTPAPYGQPYR